MNNLESLFKGENANDIFGTQDNGAIEQERKRRIAENEKNKGNEAMKSKVSMIVNSRIM